MLLHVVSVPLINNLRVFWSMCWTMSCLFGREWWFVRARKSWADEGPQSGLFDLSWAKDGPLSCACSLVIKFVKPKLSFSLLQTWRLILYVPIFFDCLSIVQAFIGDSMKLQTSLLGLVDRLTSVLWVYEHILVFLCFKLSGSLTRMES